LNSDLVRSAVVDPRGIGPAANIDAERPPRERLLEDPLAEIAGNEQTIGTIGGQRGQETQFGDADILRLVDDDEIERGLASGHMRRYPTEQIGPCDGLVLGQTGPHALKNRPQNFALLPVDACLATEPGDITVIFPTGKLPSVYNLAPLADQKPSREPVKPTFSATCLRIRADRG